MALQINVILYKILIFLNFFLNFVLDIFNFLNNLIILFSNHSLKEISLFLIYIFFIVFHYDGENLLNIRPGLKPFQFSSLFVIYFNLLVKKVFGAYFLLQLGGDFIVFRNDSLPPWLPYRKTFANRVRFVDVTRFMVECASVISYYDTLFLPQHKKLFSVNFKTNVNLTLAEKKNFREII